MMKVHFILSFLISLLISNSVNAINPSQSASAAYIEDDLFLIGEFKPIAGINSAPQLPTAGTKDGVLYIKFESPVGKMDVTINGTEGKVYSSPVNVDTENTVLTIPVKQYDSGSYLLEMKDANGGHVYGNFVVE